MLVPCVDGGIRRSGEDAHMSCRGTLGFNRCLSFRLSPIITGTGALGITKPMLKTNMTNIRIYYILYI